MLQFLCSLVVILYLYYSVIKKRKFIMDMGLILIIASLFMFAEQHDTNIIKVVSTISEPIILCTFITSSK